MGSVKIKKIMFKVLCMLILASSIHAQSERAVGQISVIGETLKDVPGSAEIITKEHL